MEVVIEGFSTALWEIVVDDGIEFLQQGRDGAEKVVNAFNRAVDGNNDGFNA